MGIQSDGFLAVAGLRQKKNPFLTQTPLSAICRHTFTWCNLPFSSKARGGASVSGGITSYDLTLQRENFSTSPTCTVISMHWLICVSVSVTCLLCSHFFILFHLSQYHLEKTQTLCPLSLLSTLMCCCCCLLQTDASKISSMHYLLYMTETAVCCTEFISADYFHFKANGSCSCSLPMIHPLYQRFCLMHEWCQKESTSILAQE